MSLSRRDLLRGLRTAGLVGALGVSVGATAACSDGNSIGEQAKRGDDTTFY